MSKYATKWEPITPEQYREMWKEPMQVYSGYTNPDGDDGLSFHPQMHTTWGDEERELLKSVARKEDKEQADWDWKFWKAIEWETES